MSTTENISEEEVTKSSRIRRTKVMITLENRQILDYIVKGATHEQIMKWVGLSEKNYWKRIAAIRKKDMVLTKAEHMQMYVNQIVISMRESAISFSTGV